MQLMNLQDFHPTNLCIIMIGLVMAGGKGSRMEFPANEKLLLEYKKPVIFM